METIQKERAIQLINRHKAKLLNKLSAINTPVAYLELINKEFTFLVNDVKNNNFNYNVEGVLSGTDTEPNFNK